MQEAKKNLRTLVKNKLSVLKVKEIENLDLAITKRLNQFLKSHLLTSQDQSITLGVYFPLFEEVNWLSCPLIRVVLAFPDVDDSKMLFRRCKLEELVDVELFGRKMKVPGQGKSSVKPDIIIVPGLAFDRAGNRLGRGGGFYDAYLKDFDGTKISICKELQLVDELPIEEHDVRVDYIITESMTIDISSK